MGDIREEMSRLGFGLMRLPVKDGAIDLPQLCDMVDSYMAAGFNYFDTAYMYHSGDSERAVKEALVKRYPRESYRLATKLPQWMMGGIEGRDRVFNEQLERTGVDFFDFYLLHSVEDGANDEAYEAFDCYNWALEKKRQGKIGRFGMSFHGTPELLERVLDRHPELEFVQIQLNYADWENPLVQAGRLYKILTERNLPIVVMEPVKGGALADTTPEIAALMRSARPEDSVASWAVRFVGSLPGVSVVLSGMSSREQMRDNIKTFRPFQPLTESEREILSRVVAAMSKLPNVQCTACRYCVDGCPQKIEIPEVFKALNTLRMYGEDSRPHFFYDGLVRRSGRAKDCVACGQCEAVCPQHLPIIELLRESSEKLDVQWQ